MDSGTRRPAVIGRKLWRGLRQYASIFVYLYVCFGAVLLYKTAVLRGHGVSYAHFGLAAVKAMILAKFMLVGHELRIDARLDRGRLIYVIASKALLFLSLLIVLSIAEEAIVGLLHGRTILDSVAEIGGGTLPEILATSLLLLLILIPYSAFRELSEALGGDRLRQILLERRTRPEQRDKSKE